MLPSSFFNRSPVLVAEELIGKVLVRKGVNGKSVKFVITETEAYEGLNDLASHARRGLTKGNAPMFEEAGTLYVYFTYGMHWLLNIVCRPKGYPSGVLIRGVEGISGPARLTKYLGIDKDLNGKKLGRVSGLWIEKRKDGKMERLRIKKTPRIGINYAPDLWKNKKWRFVLSKTD